MTKQFTFALFLLFITTAIAQNKTTISILDSETKEPITNVNIKVKGQDKGFITNHNGTFTFKTSDSLKETDTLIISHINYFTEKIIIKVYQRLQKHSPSITF